MSPEATQYQATLAAINSARAELEKKMERFYGEDEYGNRVWKGGKQRRFFYDNELQRLQQADDALSGTF